jgi:glycosyltransferase involved in cell wall biosynthesis
MRNAKGAFVAWTPYAGRTQGFIDALGLAPIYVHYLQLRKPAYAPIKYGPQFIKTLIELYKVKPNIVFAMAPPVFAVGAVYLYCSLSRSHYVMDCHSGVFESSKWRWSFPLLRYFGRHAKAVLVTNSQHNDLVTSWPAESVILSDPPPKIPRFQVSDNIFSSQKNVAVVNRFAPDELVDEMLEAAGWLPDVRFHVTGDIGRAKSRWLTKNPENVKFTNWLPNDRYWGYLYKSNLILTLTNKENTLLRGAWEAMYLGQPLVTSNTQTLRNYFTAGTIFVDGTPESIANGISRCLDLETELREEMNILREDKKLEWKNQIHKLEDLIGYQFH